MTTEHAAVESQRCGSIDCWVFAAAGYTLVLAMYLTMVVSIEWTECTWWSLLDFPDATWYFHAGRWARVVKFLLADAHATT